MDIWLADGVRAVAIGDDIVFLDVAADAYLCLVGAADQIVLRSDGSVLPRAPDAAETLLQAGLAATTAQRPQRVPPPKPTLDLPPATRRATPTQIAALGLACLSTAAAFRFHAFQTLLERAAAGRARTGVLSGEAGPRQAAVLEAAAVFARLRPWSPVGGACLMRSHLQLRYLRGLGLDADWVIGVRTWPFMAHCWLQAGPVALDDDVERLVAYTPILVV